MSNTKNLISLFSGALGLDLGFEQAGFVLRAAVECNQFAIQTIKDNKEHLKSKNMVIIDRPMLLRNVEAICEEKTEEVKKACNKQIKEIETICDEYVENMLNNLHSS